MQTRCLLTSRCCFTVHSDYSLHSTRIQGKLDAGSNPILVKIPRTQRNRNVAAVIVTGQNVRKVLLYSLRGLTQRYKHFEIKIRTFKPYCYCLLVTYPSGLHFIKTKHVAVDGTKLHHSLLRKNSSLFPLTENYSLTFPRAARFPEISLF